MVLKSPDLSRHDKNGHPLQERYSVQIAVFGDLDNANLMKSRLANSRVQPYIAGENQLYRVVVGEHANFHDAVKERDRIRQRGYSKAYVVSSR